MTDYIEAEKPNSMESVSGLSSNGMALSLFMEEKLNFSKSTASNSDIQIIDSDSTLRSGTPKQFEQGFFKITAAEDTSSVSRYPLPKVEVNQYSGEASLEELNKQIRQRALETVQGRMSPEEKRKLNEDSQIYEKEVAAYKKYMRGVMMGTGGLGLDTPPPPKPESIQRYERAIDNEIKRLVGATTTPRN